MAAATYSSGNYPVRLNRREGKVVETATSVASSDATSKANAAQAAAIAAIEANLSHYVVLAVVATTADATTDFNTLEVGDLVIHIPASAGNSEFAETASAGTNPLGNAVVSDLYVALRAK